MIEPRRETTVDHVVINSLFDMDEAVADMAALGFSLTPRGYHTLGSINHLIVLDDSYLELVGLPRNGETIRKEMLDFPLGINGLVFAETSPDARYADLVQEGFAAEPPQHFSRPVESGEGIRDARFTAVRLAGSTFPAGRVYFCQHHTPELVWQEEWSHHANTAYSVAGMTVVGVDPAADAGIYGRYVGQLPAATAAEWHITLAGNRRDDSRTPLTINFIDELEYRARFGDMACSSLDRKSFFGCVRIRVRSLDALTSALDQSDSGLSWRPLAHGVIAVQIRRFNCLFEFIEE